LFPNFNAQRLYKAAPGASALPDVPPPGVSIFVMVPTTSKLAQVLMKATVSGTSDPGVGLDGITPKNAEKVEGAIEMLLPEAALNEVKSL
jgi:hypothetical protein